MSRASGRASRASEPGSPRAYKDKDSSLPQAVSCAPLVVTSVQSVNNAPLNLAPILAGDVLYDLATASLMVGRSTGHLRVVLCRHANLFDQPHYTRRGKREFRLLTARDLATLRAMWPVYVKSNRRVT